MTLRAAGLIYGPDFHHLDHLAPLCVLLQIPLVLSEEEIAAQARRYYPGLEVVHLDYSELSFSFVEHFEVAFCCLPRLLFDEVFFFAQKLRGKKVHTIWCPHGNSDKGHHSFFFKALDQEKVALVYGPKMIDLFIQKGVFKQLKAHVAIDNLRYSFYEKNKPFYQQIVQREIEPKLDRSAIKTLLFAPTWQDHEGSSAFFSACPLLIEKLPPHWNLIVKLHPNLLLQDQLRIDTLLETHVGHPRLLFLPDFPPIYPLLDLVDLYIGDRSSIGYDFLTFDKPMFFLNENQLSSSDPALHLHRCGISLEPPQYPEIYEIIQKHLLSDQRPFSQQRKETYAYTFGPRCSEEKLQQQILATYAVFEDDLGFL